MICTTLTNLLQEAMAAFIPSKIVTTKPEDKVWFEDQCKSAATEKVQLNRTVRTWNDLASKQKFLEARHNITTS